MFQQMLHVPFYFINLICQIFATCQVSCSILSAQLQLICSLKEAWSAQIAAAFCFQSKSIQDRPTKAYLLTCCEFAKLRPAGLVELLQKGSLPWIPSFHTQRSPTKLQNRFFFAFAPRWVLLFWLFCSMVASWKTLDLVRHLVIRMSGKHYFFHGTVALWHCSLTSLPYFVWT